LRYYFEKKVNNLKQTTPINILISKLEFW
jgi:hypothetical protein